MFQCQMADEGYNKTVKADAIDCGTLEGFSDSVQSTPENSKLTGTAKRCKLNKRRIVVSKKNALKFHIFLYSVLTL